MIDTKLLRQKILDLAIRGKLVPQTPADEPASELLKKIKAEKEELVKAGKIKKDKHESFIFKGDDNRYYETIDGKTTDITEEIPFDIPDSWAWCRLRNFCITIVDCPHSTPHYQTTPTSCWAIDTNCIDKNGYIIRKRFLGDNEFIARTKQCVPRGNDIIMSREGTIGLVAILPTGERICLGQRVMLLRPSSNCIPLYMRNTLATEKFLSQFLSKSRGMGVQHINVEDIRNGFFPLPPLAEQQRIVEQIKKLLGYVDIIDTDAETLEKSITLAKQKILDLAIRGKLVPQDPTDEPASELLKKIKAEKEALVKAGKIKKDKHESFIFKGDDNCYHENIVGKVTDITDEILFDLPVGWEWCRLATISEFDLGKTLDRQKNTGNYRKYLRSVNVLWGNIDLADVKEMRFEDTELERYSIKKGDLLICEGGDVGRCAVWDKDFVFYYQNALHRVRFYQKCVPLFYQFVMMFFENTGLLKEISQGVTIKHLTKNTLNSMFFPLPPLAEQKRIVSQIEKLFAVLETMRG